MKIIMTVFGVVFILFFIQAAVGYVSYEKKKEHFENKEDDSKDSKADVKKQGEKSSPDSKSESKSDSKQKASEPITENKNPAKSLKLSILESVEDVFDSQFPGSNQKSIMFDKLLQKEQFEDIREKSENGENVFDVVKGYIKDHMKKVVHEEENALRVTDYFDQPPKNINIKDLYKDYNEKEREENFTAKEDGTAKDKTIQELKSELEELGKRMSTIQYQLDALSNNSPKGSSTPSSKSPEVVAGKKSVIEGFENRYHYAAF